MGGKNPNMLEKAWSVRVGVILICLEVDVASVRAMIRPVIVTASAASLSRGGIVIMGVFSGKKFKVIINPATMLPQARRSIDAITAGWFSLMGGREENRGEPMITKKTIRRLYTAVKEVAISVRARAQAFKWEVLRASMIASFEKKPVRKGMPVRARLPIIKQEEVNGISFCSPPIFRISCSLLRLWMIEPEHRKSMALKKACVQMCKKASWG